jgi:hypothetical protein
MSKTAKVYLAVVAALVAVSIPVGLLSAGASPASTAACGSACISPSNQFLGIGEELAVGSTTTSPAGTTTSVGLSTSSTTNSAEDWTLEAEGVVSNAVSAGVVSAKLDMLYSGQTLVELQSAPDGSPSDKCLADTTFDGPSTTVAMEQCGITAQSLWIVDGNNVSDGYVDLINAGYAVTYTYPVPVEEYSGEYTNPFAEPYVLTETGGDGVDLAPLSEIGGVVSSTQMWSDVASVASSALQAKSDKSK